MKKSLLLVHLLLSCVLLSFAQDSDVQVAYQKYKRGARLSAKDEYHLAEVFLEGYYGEEFNPDKYMSLIRSSAKRGNEDAKWKVETGQDYADVSFAYLMEDDLADSYVWGIRAIEVTGSYTATESIGLVCANRALNSRIHRYYEDAYYYALLGTYFGNSGATAELALCYRYGYEVEKDVEKAYSLMREARRLPHYNDLEGVYERAYNDFGRQVNNRRLSAIQVQQRQAENHFKSSPSSYSSSPKIRSIVAIGAVIAGIVAICDALDNSCSSPSSSSSTSSKSNLPIDEGCRVKCFLWSGPSGYYGRVTEVNGDKCKVYIDEVEIKGFLKIHIGACAETGWKDLALTTHYDYDYNKQYYGDGTIIEVPKRCLERY